jgi:type I restriction enzyme S subunit
MSKFPDDWDVIELAEAGIWLSGGTPLTSNSTFWDGHIPWISASSLKKFDIDDSDRRVTTLGAASGTRSVPRDTVLFVVRGMSLKSEFRVGITRRDVTFGQDCKAILPRSDIDSRYLAYSLDAHSNKILSIVDEAGHGTGRLPTPQLAKLKIGVPSRGEQRKIAEILDTMGKSIRSTERLIAKVCHIADATTSRLLDPTSDPTRWDVHSLESVSDIKGGVTLGSANAASRSVELPYLRVANVQDGYLDLDEVKMVSVLKSEIDRFALQNGDVLMTEGGDFDKLGRGAVWHGQISPCLHQNHIFRVRCHQSVVLPEFLAAYSRSHQGRKYFLGCAKQTTNLASINMKQLSRYPVPIPPIDEQNSIVSVIRSVAQELAAHQAELAKLRRTKQGLMDDLLTGRVRVSVD